MCRCEPARYQLAEDVKSVFHMNKANIIARTENVLIVEDKNEERFPVNIEKLIKINKS